MASKTFTNALDRVGSTFVQAFVGALAAAQISGLGDLKSAAIAAFSAAVVAVVKVVGVQAASVTQPEVQDATESTIKAIAAKLKN